MGILNHLSKHGKILQLHLGFCVGRVVQMKPRDRDFLIVLRGVKTDKLAFGDPRLQLGDRVDVRLSQSIFPCQSNLFLFRKALYDQC